MTADPYRYFRIEARELLDQLGDGILAVERGAVEQGLVDRLLRHAHTLKGAARVVRLATLAEDAHALEDLLAALRDGSGTHDVAAASRMLVVVDRMRAQLASLGVVPGPGGGQPATDAAPGSGAMRPGDEAIHAFRPDADDIDGVAQGLSATEAALRGVDDAMREVQHARRLLDVIDDHLSVSTVARRTEDGRTLDDGLRAITAEVRRRLGALERSGVQAVERANREIHLVAEATARLHLAPARAMFRFLERATRDAALAQGKRVRFEAAGGDLRLEPEMLSLLQTACLHVVRNAVAHGVETDLRERDALGKPAEATVRVTVERVREYVRVSCTDDGGGIDLDRVRAALRQRGVAHLPADPDALLRVLLESGVSTATTVTSLAGRGIGLGVVRDVAVRLGGRVHVRTRPGAGTTVELIVPFALASLAALLVDAADVPAAVPLDAVNRIVKIEEHQLARSARGAALMIDGEAVPVGALHAVVAPERAAPSIGGRPALIVRSGDRLLALVVDRVHPATTVTVRPLPALAPAHSVAVGAAIDPSGRPRLVLEPHALIERVSTSPTMAAVPTGRAEAVLVVDDSLTTRMLEQSILESAGYVVGLASSGSEGLEKARSGDYALFLVDVEMPDMDGFTFVEHVRAEPRLATTPIILVTSRAAAEDRERGRRAGANAYIVKSEFDQQVLLSQIRSLTQS